MFPEIRLGESEDDIGATPGDDVGSDLFNARFRFAEQAFNNVHALNRAIDLKANYLITAVGILTTALGILAGGALGIKTTGDWAVVTRGAGLVLTLAYLLAAFSVVRPAALVFQALSEPLLPDTEAPGLLFPTTLLRRFKAGGKPSEEMYLNKLMSTGQQEFLMDYINQILEVSNVYNYKQTQINLSIRRFHWLSVLWVLAAMLLVAIVVLLPRA